MPPVEKKILVFIPNPELNLSLCKALSARGYLVFSVSNAVEAAERKGKGPFFCVIADLSLPENEAAKFLSSSASSDEATILIALSGYSCAPSGFPVKTFFIKKPFEIYDLENIFSLFHPEEPGKEAVISTADESEKKRIPIFKKRGPVFYLLLSCVLSAGIFMYFKKSGVDASAPFSLNSGMENISSLCAGENRLYAADWLKQKINFYEIYGSSVNFKLSVSLTDAHPDSLFLKEDKLYLFDSWKKTLEIRKASDLSYISSLGVPDGARSAAFDGERILFLFDGGALRFFSLPAMEPAGGFSFKPVDSVSFDSGKIWLFSFSRKEIRSYSLSGEPGRVFPLPVLSGIKTAPTAGTVFSGQVYLSFSNGEIISRSLSDLEDFEE